MTKLGAHFLTRWNMKSINKSKIYTVTKCIGEAEVHFQLNLARQQTVSDCWIQYRHITYRYSKTQLSKIENRFNLQRTNKYNLKIRIFYSLVWNIITYSKTWIVLFAQMSHLHIVNTFWKGLKEIVICCFFVGAKLSTAYLCTLANFQSVSDFFPLFHEIGLLQTYILYRRVGRKLYFSDYGWSWLNYVSSPLWKRFESIYIRTRNHALCIFVSHFGSFFSATELHLDGFWLFHLCRTDRLSPEKDNMKKWIG